MSMFKRGTKGGSGGGSGSAKGNDGSGGGGKGSLSSSSGSTISSSAMLSAVATTAASPGGEALIMLKVVVSELSVTKVMRVGSNISCAEAANQLAQRVPNLDPNSPYALASEDSKFFDESRLVSTLGLASMDTVLLKKRPAQLAPPQPTAPSPHKEEVSTSPPAQQPTSSPQTAAISPPPQPQPSTIPPHSTTPQPRVKPLVKRVAETAPNVDNEQDLKMKKSKISHFLNVFLRKRPATEELITAKILFEKPAPVLLPPQLTVVVKCCDWLAANALDLEGLFRVSGPTNDTNAICESLLSGVVPWEVPGAPPIVNPHTVASALKLYFREKTQPLIPYNVYRSYLEKMKKNVRNEEAHLAACKDAICGLPDQSEKMLIYLLKFLVKLSTREEENKMSIFNIAVVWGPTLLKAQMTGMDLFSECEFQIQFVSFTMKNLTALENAIVPESKQVAPASVASVSAPPPPCPWFFDDMSDDEIHRVLANAPSGTFLITVCSTNSTCYTVHWISMGVEFTENITHSGDCWKKGSDEKEFVSLAHLVSYYTETGDFVYAFKRQIKPTLVAAPSSTSEGEGLAWTKSPIADCAELLQVLLSSESQMAAKRIAAKHLATMMMQDQSLVSTHFNGLSPTQLATLTICIGQVIGTMV
ncbi:rho GTPase-activating protein 33 [Pelomyxa schiedti]|nr:rho GTPase-activating protein 33 [Pelomyxa schiedti]